MMHSIGLIYEFMALMELEVLSEKKTTPKINKPK